MQFIDFDSIPLPDVQAVTDVSRAARYMVLETVSLASGAYDLFGDESPLPVQMYHAEFIYLNGYAMQASLDNLLARVGKRKILRDKQWDNSIRRITAKLVSAKQSTDVPDRFGGMQKITCDFHAEPFWYADSVTTVNFGPVSTVNLTGSNGNLGNARAIKNLVLTITNGVGLGTFTATITPTTGTASQITFNAPGGGATGATLAFDAGQHTVYDGSTNRYSNTARPTTQVPLLFMEPGDSVLTFTAALYGNVVFRSCWR